MAEAEAAAHAGSKGLGVLTQKAGPLPLYVWGLAFIAIWWYFQKKNTSSAASSQATDPAGNTGVIDPSTGYVYGSPSDQAALGSSSGTASGTTPSGGGTVAGQYADNDAWGRAAINYLVGVGVDPATANEAVQSFLSSQPLTSAQQADVNLAIQALGAPPQSVGAVGNTPAPVVSPPPSTTGTTGTTGGTTSTGTGSATGSTSTGSGSKQNGNQQPAQQPPATTAATGTTTTGTSTSAGGTGGATTPAAANDKNAGGPRDPSVNPSALNPPQSYGPGIPGSVLVVNGLTGQQEWTSASSVSSLPAGTKIVQSASSGSTASRGMTKTTSTVRKPAAVVKKK